MGRTERKSRSCRVKKYFKGKRAAGFIKAVVFTLDKFINISIFDVTSTQK
jgi:hypothetical protein